MSRKKKIGPLRKKKIGAPGSMIPKPMYVKDPIWGSLAHIAYRSAAELALASGAPPYPYKLSRLTPVREAGLPKYKMNKGVKRTRGGPNANS